MDAHFVMDNWAKVTETIEYGGNIPHWVGKTFDTQNSMYVATEKAEEKDRQKSCGVYGH